jgi:hypothetical protein
MPLRNTYVLPVTDLEGPIVQLAVSAMFGDRGWDVGMLKLPVHKLVPPSILTCCMVLLTCEHHT